jgi:hypothetical protein
MGVFQGESRPDGMEDLMVKRSTVIRFCRKRPDRFCRQEPAPIFVREAAYTTNAGSLSWIGVDLEILAHCVSARTIRIRSCQGLAARTDRDDGGGREKQSPNMGRVFLLRPVWTCSDDVLIERVLNHDGFFTTRSH